MQIKFGYTFDDRRKLEKSVTWFNTFDCKPYTDYNISAPNLLILNGTGAIANNNYAYIADYQRYYFVDSVTIGRNGMYIVQLSIDVLMTYRDDIMASHGLITKNREYNPYTGDVDVESRYTLEKHEFENGFDFTNGDFVLVTMRG